MLPSVAFLQPGEHDHVAHSIFAWLLGPGLNDLALLSRAFALSCVANASDPHGRVSLRERADRVHSFALDDCRTIAADIAAVGRATLPGSC